MSEARYKRLADNARDIIFRYDFLPAMGLTYINPAVETLTGYTPDDCYADPQLMFTMVYPDDAASMAEFDGVSHSPGRAPADALDRQGRRHPLDGEPHRAGARRRGAALGGRGHHAATSPSASRARTRCVRAKSVFGAFSAATSDFAYSCVNAARRSLRAFVNWLTDAVERITGWSREELLGWGLLESSHPSTKTGPLFEEQVAGLAPGGFMLCDLRSG